MFKLANIQDGNEVFQRCLLVRGHANVDGGDSVSVETKNEAGRIIFPRQRWPMCQGWFKALLMLSPGQNTIVFTGEATGDAISKPVHQITIRYTPLLQTPPLHLAILVAQDSPLFIDCPPAKFGGLSSTHSGLEAAIAKFRMTAYMWQALTADDLFSKGLGRRSFRLEEEWAADTVSRSFVISDGTTEAGDRMQSTAKVHLIRTSKTVAELRDAQIAQQNQNGQRRDELHQIFTQSIKTHGSPFLTEAKPVVAGLILDSHFDAGKNLILAHAALGSHDPNGLSLGIFGSHTTYAWPRFLEEVAFCLSDTTSPGDTVGNDANECGSMWEACAVGQGAFLHEVGHAFSAPHTSGIMERGYSPDWPKCFLAETAYCVHAKTQGISPVNPDTSNDCNWDVRDALRFHSLPHFRHPSDSQLSKAGIDIELQDDSEEDFVRIKVTCEAGIAQVLLGGEIEPVTSIAAPTQSFGYTIDELETRFPSTKTLELEILASNGKHRVVDVFKFMAAKTYIRLPGSTIRLKKQAVTGGDQNICADDWEWTVMLKKRGHDGSLVNASKIDIRVGCGLDGAIVYYKDGSQVPCGPRGRQGGDPGMGGHQSRKMAIPRGVDVVKVAVTKCEYWSLRGLRMWLSNGQARGALNKQEGEVEVLTPGKDERIVGFFGTSGGGGMVKKFGIVTAPKNARLPDSMYDMEELQNLPLGRPSKRVKRSNRDDEDDSDHTEGEDSFTSEDNDSGYDNDSDVEFDADD
ncbi:putative peptidase family-domain-containing protein [Podospora didyma]|uniref:Peptidase family-domain-containing protein n=1 Tax=Podospora didyma TaxID=330526 RepID=A0AAE0U0B4_9PEZI|nr:putative peptidase family-domain-containing protein [Podospora didyma]